MSPLNDMHTSKPRWPVSVILVQGALLLVTGLFAVGIARGGLNYRYVAWWPMVLSLAVLGFCLMTSWGLIHRRPYARWLGLLFILWLLANLGPSAVRALLSSEGALIAAVPHSVDTLEGQAGYVFARRYNGLLFTALLGWLFMAFGYGRKAKAFFGVEDGTAKGVP